MAQEVWHEMTRKSEKKKDSVHHPRNRGDGNLYRIYWQECRDEDVLEEILIRGRAVFGAQFHFSEWYVRKVKPFYVKTAKREQCLCQY